MIFACSLVLCFARLGETRAGTRLKCVAFLGNATYSSYLIHFPIQLAIVTVVNSMGYSRNIFLTPGVMLAYLALVVALSLATYHWFELPAQNWIRQRSWTTSERMIASSGIDSL